MEGRGREKSGIIARYRKDRKRSRRLSISNLGIFFALAFFDINSLLYKARQLDI